MADMAEFLRFGRYRSRVSANFRYRRAVRREARSLLHRLGLPTALARVAVIRGAACDPQVRAFAYNLEQEIRESGAGIEALFIKPRHWIALFDKPPVALARRAGFVSSDSLPDDMAVVLAKFRMAQLAPAGPLTERQLECLGWVAQGKSSADIATILGLSKRTIDEHLAAACDKLGVKTRVQAVKRLSEINGLGGAP